VLGIVSDEYEVVDHRDAFRFLDALIGADRLRSPFRNSRQPVGRLARLVPATAARMHRARRRPLGDLYLRGQQPRRVDGGHRGCHPDPDRVRRHAQVLGMTIAYQKQLKAIADRLARERIQRLRSSTASCATCG
jgi:hypothetical protein